MNRDQFFRMMVAAIVFSLVVVGFLIVTVILPMDARLQASEKGLEEAEARGKAMEFNSQEVHLMRKDVAALRSTAAEIRGDLSDVQASLTEVRAQSSENRKAIGETVEWTKRELDAGMRESTTGGGPAPVVASVVGGGRAPGAPPFATRSGKGFTLGLSGCRQTGDALTFEFVVTASDGDTDYEVGKCRFFDDRGIEYPIDTGRIANSDFDFRTDRFHLSKRLVEGVPTRMVLSAGGLGEAVGEVSVLYVTSGKRGPRGIDWEVQEFRGVSVSR